MNRLKINIFAFPKLTTALFWLAISALFLVIWMSLSPHLLFYVWPTITVLVILSIREFIMQPERNIHRFKFIPIGDNFPLLQKVVNEKARQLGLKRIPKLLLGEKQNTFYRMGSFRRWYIVVSSEKASLLETQLSNPEKAVLADLQILSVLYPFTASEYWMVGYLAILLKVTFYLVLWGAVFFVGWALLLILIKDSLVYLSSPDLITKVSSEMRPIWEQLSPLSNEFELLKVNDSTTLYFLLSIINIIVPCIALISFLWIFYYPIMLCIQQYYSDAGIAQTLKSTASFWTFFQYAQKLPSIVDLESRRSSFNRLQEWLQNILMGSFFPNAAERLNAIQNPDQVFYQWKQIARFLGTSALLLDMLFYLSGYLMYLANFTTMSIVIVIIFWSLPQIVMKKDVWKDCVIILAAIFGLRTTLAAFVLTILWGIYTVKPSFFEELITVQLYASARYAGTNIPTIIINGTDFLMASFLLNLQQMFLLFVASICFVMAYILLSTRALQWYGFFTTRYRFNIFNMIVIGVFIGLLLTFLILPEFGSGIFAIVGYLTLIVCGVLWIVFMDKRYYKKCPVCKSRIADIQKFDVTCANCQAKVLPWLVAQYETE